jgi:hypothetical protein
MLVITLYAGNVFEKALAPMEPENQCMWPHHDWIS